MVVSIISARISLHLENGTSIADDWLILAGARVASLFFTANLEKNRVPLSKFYILSALNEAQLIKDFEGWEVNSPARFSLCGFPFLLSLGAKIQLLQFDKTRQMHAKAREAFRSILVDHRFSSPFVMMDIRREHLIRDSLRQISENRSDLNKRLKVSFTGENGIDAGEWTLRSAYWIQH